MVLSLGKVLVIVYLNSARSINKSKRIFIQTTCGLFSPEENSI